MTASTIITITELLEAEIAELGELEDKACRKHHEEAVTLEDNGVPRELITGLDSYKTWQEIKEKRRRLLAAYDDFTSHEFH